MEMGDRIKFLRRQKGITQEELGQIVGVQKAAVQKWESGMTKNLKRDTIEKLSNYFGVRPSFLMGMDEEELKGEYNKNEILKAVLGDITMLPIVGTIRAGEPILAMESVEGYFPMDNSILNIDKKYFFLKVKGDSMNLEFKEGSLLLVEKTPCIENGEIGVVLVNAHEATVKKIVKNDNMITLIPMSSNHIHTPQMINLEKQQVEIIGKVKMAIKQY